MPGNVNIYLLISAGMLFSFFIAGALVLFYIRYRQRLTRQQWQAQEDRLRHQQELLHAVIASQEKERERIGRDLHDDVGTALSNLRMTIERFTISPADNVLTGAFGHHCKTTIDRMITDVRNIAHNLSPSGLGLYGFPDAIEELTENINQSGRLSVSIIYNNTTDRLQQLDHAHALNLYRVLEELLTNTIKHAAAQQATISFCFSESSLLIRYNDDGIGMTGNTGRKKGMGLQNIESRLAIMQAGYAMQQAGTNGFSMEICVPVNKNLV